MGTAVLVDTAPLFADSFWATVRSRTCPAELIGTVASHMVAPADLLRSLMAPRARLEDRRVLEEFQSQCFGLLMGQLLVRKRLP